MNEAYHREVRNLSISEMTKDEKKSGLSGEEGERERGASDFREVLRRDHKRKKRITFTIDSHTCTP